MTDLKSIIEGIVSQAKVVGSGGSAFRSQSVSNASRSDQPGSHAHGLDIGARRNASHEIESQKRAEDNARKREQETQRRVKEANQRKKETMNMAKEEIQEEFHPDYKLVKTGKKSTIAHPDGKPTYEIHHKGEKVATLEPYSAYKDTKIPGKRYVAARKDVTKYAINSNAPGINLNSQNRYHSSSNDAAEHFIRQHQNSLKEETVQEAKGFVYDKPQAHMVRAYKDRSTGDLHGMHSRWSNDHKNPKAKPDTSEKLLAVHHILKSRGENVGELPKHRNLGVHQMIRNEETNTEKRMKIKNVAHPDDADPKSDKSTLGKTGSIKTKVIDERKLTMSLPNFGLPASLISAVRQIVEKKQDDDDKDPKKMLGGKTAVELEPETNDKVDDEGSAPKTAKEKKLAALAEPKDKVTHKDVLVGRGVVKEEEVEQVDEKLNNSGQKYYDSHNGTHPEAVDKLKSHMKRLGWKNVGSEQHNDNLSTHRFERKSLFGGVSHATGIVGKNRNGSHAIEAFTTHGSASVREEVALSVEEKARIAEIAKSFQTKVDEAVKKTVPSATTATSSPVRGANQDQSGFGTKSSTADYTISDEKKVRKEEVELDEGRGRPRKNPAPGGSTEAEGDDTHKHPMQQLEKISHSIEGSEPHFEHKDGSKSKMGRHLARHIVSIHNSMRTTQEKDNFAQKVHANRDSMKAEVSKHI